MPILTPSTGPPRSPLADKPSNLPIPSGLVTSTELKPSPAATQNRYDSDRLVEEPSRKIPRVILQEDFIQDVVAAQIATSILGHVLFLKNQIPFPVKQLSRVPIGKSNPRALKLKNELLESYDTISAHLVTTFRAISTALARARTRQDRSHVSKVYMAILLGPSIGTAKSKVVISIDGLETKIWGLDVIREREERVNAAAVEASQTQRTEDDDESDSEPEDSNEDTEESESEESESDAEDEPPSSDVEGDEGADSTDESLEDTSRDDIPTAPVSPIREARPNTIVRYGSANAEQRTRSLRDADRILSRTLAQAEADGLGMASEMAPTQTHFLIRAPRRFDHPAWIPRQNIQLSMDSLVEEYGQEAALSPDTSTPPTKKKKRGPTLEGVWIGCNSQAEELKAEGDSEVPEDDQMIWWSWDGKIVGFSDW